MSRTNRYAAETSTSSILNQDQLEQIVSRNQTFLRDFLLVICCVVVFIIILMFIVLVMSINRAMELNTAAQIERQRTFLANLDLRNRPSVAPPGVKT
ncbi:se49 [Alphabaculovirus alterspexiguae]|uniref:Se49 n=1 Tax=Spodoptera exigua multiple nucleopolyhedrovirus TaxID=10454 RepID=A0A3G2JTZ2_9ABAC|nr:se49 [Spodoptera exigua multiple nucleopolyhedrovirus]AYN45009.1 se49 [Spodoptera exigua multiple nucleopolyhedrovirus]